MRTKDAGHKAAASDAHADDCEHDAEAQQRVARAVQLDVHEALGVLHALLHQRDVVAARLETGRHGLEGRIVRLVGQHREEFPDIFLAGEDVIARHIGLTRRDTVRRDQKRVVGVIGHDGIKIASHHRLHVMIEHSLRGVGGKCHVRGQGHAGGNQ